MNENNNVNDMEIDNSEAPVTASKPNIIFVWVLTLGLVGMIVIIGLAWIINKRSATTMDAGKTETTTGDKEPEKLSGSVVKLDSEMLNAAGLSIEHVTQRPAVAKLYFTGSVELNPEKTEMATPLVGGRVEKVFYGVGDYVNRGATLAVISSPQLAQLHGKMHEARTRYELAQRNLTRVQKSENRISILQAKAKLDESEATLNRTKRLIELGAGAGKDLIAAETVYKTAKANYDFQANISLNKEIQEAKAEGETSKVDVTHIEDEMRAFGVPYNANEPDDHTKNSSLVAVRSPLSGIITERKFNAGAGIDAATAMFSISDLATVYVIANVPEANVNKLFVGSVAEVRSMAAGTITGRISYIDPSLDEITRTARVRLEVANPGGKLRAGMFTDVGFYAGTNSTMGEELVVPTTAIQRSGDKTVVFIPRENVPGEFEVREVESGGESDGYTRILGGLRLGEKIVTKGSFTLKTQLEKGSIGDEE